MPDMQNENRFMAMLERRGIVRKADTEEKLAETDPVGVETRPEADLQALFNPQSDSGAPKVTPAARQPVPGLSNPTFPGERSSLVEREQTPPPVGRVEPVLPRPSADAVQREEPRPLAEPVPVAQPESVELPRLTPFVSSIDPFKSNAAPDERPVAVSAIPVAPSVPPTAEYETPPAPLSPVPPPPPVENYTERYLDIDELYSVLNLKSKRTDTIFLIEEYIKSLPESLPDESRREIVSKIVAASGFDFDLLMGDGILRVKMLKDYAERFAGYTDDYVAYRNAELDELEQQSLRIRRLIENRKELHKKQFFTIEAEAQRLKDILTFISG